MSVAADAFVFPPSVKLQEPFFAGVFGGDEVTAEHDDAAQQSGDGSDDAQCVSEFMAGDVGVRFQVQCTAQDDPMNRASLCSTLLVRQALSQPV